MVKKAKKVSDHDLDILEQQVPRHASEATYSAHLRALSANRQGILCIEGAELVRITADGTRTLLDHVKPKRRVKVGEVITVRKVAGAKADERA
ncbi:hypothetical protein ACQKPE_01060 [Pseudomonas sp. NPDC089554]|uniref:hypothetical protein n=1 Tax=Pseudomonas sp. NPDC089554 TaxID=3390653 RepID=UPI003D06348A